MDEWSAHLKRLARRFGFQPDMKNPRHLCEKILWKVRYDRNPLLTKTADKYAVREYIAERVGVDYLIPLYGVTDKAEDMLTMKIENPCVVKPNHGCGWIYFIPDPNDINRQELYEKCKEWLNTNYTDKYTFEWAYKDIEPKILVEMLLEENNDYQLYMFDGECKVLRVRFGPHSTAYYTPDWEPIDVGYGKFKRSNQTVEKPDNLSELLSIASKLSAPFDFVRTDFYINKGKIYCGEITHYPGGGTVCHRPTSFDLELGSYWKL